MQSLNDAEDEGEKENENENRKLYKYLKCKMKSLLQQQRMGLKLQMEEWGRRWMTGVVIEINYYK